MTPSDDALDDVLHGSRRADRVAADWRETILAKVETKARAHRNHHGNIRGASLTINVGLGFVKALNAAAEARGISRVAYLRRAVGAFLAADLGLDFAGVMGECPRATPFDPHRRWVAGTGDDDGTGYGTWHVEAGQTKAVS